MNVVDSGDNEVWRACSRKVESEECCDEDGVGEPDCGGLLTSDCEENLGVVVIKCRDVAVTSIGFHLIKREAGFKLLILRCRRVREGNM